jgi:hypothetical protein
MRLIDKNPTGGHFGAIPAPMDRPPDIRMAPYADPFQALKGVYLHWTPPIEEVPA